MAHYKTESHLVREHRIRMETPGMALYDKDECELQGLAPSPPNWIVIACW